MIQLSDEQLNNLGKEALVVIVSSLQDQLLALQSQLDHANAQLSLFDSFNEVEYLKQDSLKEPEITEVIIPSYHRKKAVGKRESDLSGLPARIIEHTLSDEELAVKFPDGYKELPEEVYKRLHIIPETFIVDEHHVHVYASKSNDGTILKAPRPKDLFRNSIATPALVASIINGKYTNALPLERQSKAFKTNGIQLSTNTMANWVIKSTDVYLSLIYDRLHELIYDSKVIHADESPIKVMRIDHAKIKNGKKTYMWIYRNRPLRETHPVVLFDWQPSRHSDHPREFLNTFSGTVVTDGYQVYHKLAKERRDLKVAGYWVHARRPFAEFIKSVGQDTARGSIAQEAYLRVFLSDGNVPMDNNYAEQAIRPFTIGRKNFVMIESSNGAKASAILYSLVETAKANMINTFEYFNLLLTEIPQHMDDKDLRFIDDLLPWSPRVQKECPSRYKKSCFFNVHIYSVKSAQSPLECGDF